MANVYGVNYTKFNTPSPENKVEGEQVGGRVRWIHDSYECSATASGTVIYLGKLPKGAYVLPGSYLFHDALGSANVSVGTIIGSTTSATALSAAESVSSAGNIDLAETVDIVGTPMSGEAIIIAVPDAAITGTIRLSLAYAWK